MKQLWLIPFFLFVIFAKAQNNDFSVDSEINEVTVFLKGAQVVRNKTIDVPSGVSVFKFTNLSPYVDAKSIQVKFDEKVSILSVNHQFNYLETEKYSSEIAALKAKFEELNVKLKIENTNLEVNNDELFFLKENRIIGGKNQELSLNNLKETSKFYRERVSYLKLKNIEIEKNIQLLNDEYTKLTKQFSKAGSEAPSPSSEVLVKVVSSNKTNAKATLTYFVSNASWFPSYDIKSFSVDQPLELVYKANILQSTKENWKNVKLKLSTTNPVIGNVSPQLETYFLDYNLAPPKYKTFNNTVSGIVYDDSEKKPLPGVSVNVKGTSIYTTTNLEGNYSITVPQNGELVFSYVGYQQKTVTVDKERMDVYLSLNESKLEEVVVQASGVKKSTASAVAIRGKVSGVNVNYKNDVVEKDISVVFDVKLPYSLPSNNIPTVVEIENYKANTEYQYVCVPKVDKDAFLIAKIPNWEKYHLLEGEANIFFEDTFVGKSLLETRNATDTLSLSLGRDKNVVVNKEKVGQYTSKSIFGSKKEEVKNWSYTIKNNKKQAISILIKDQVPVSVNDEIEVQVQQLSNANYDKEKGMLSWLIPMNSFEVKKMELKYSVKYPKNKRLNIE